jgi:hypothetical protein
MLTPGDRLGDVPLIAFSHMTFRLIYQKNKMGINEVPLFLHADLRTFLFSACSAFRPIFYCPKAVHFEFL